MVGKQQGMEARSQSKSMSRKISSAASAGILERLSCLPEISQNT